jgi:hypothetical protein
VSEAGELEELDSEEMVYIAYGEQGEDIAFDITDELSEGILITNQMQEDGFDAKLFQGRVIYTPTEE